MNASFGIDHPLIATKNIEDLRSRFLAMGFSMTAIGKHPWGTSTSLAMFNGCLIEIMGMYDDTLLDELPAGDFRFGRHIHEYLNVREGVALTALHSTDSIADARRAQQAGLNVSGHLEFGRDVTLPDGKCGRTKTTLALIPNTKWPRLSFFLCQQHKPELIYVPQWLEHPNTVFGMDGVTVHAAVEHHSALQMQLQKLYGDIQAIDGGFKVHTANGALRVQTSKAIESQFAPLSSEVLEENQPGIVAMDLIYKHEQALLSYLWQSNTDFRTVGDQHILTNPAQTANLFIRFKKVVAG